MKREEENLKEKREKEDSKKVGAHNFLSSTQKTPRKRHKHNKEERRERKIQVLDKTKGEQTKNKKKREEGELYLYSSSRLSFVYISTQTHKVSILEKEEEIW